MKSSSRKTLAVNIPNHNIEGKAKRTFFATGAGTALHTGTGNLIYQIW